jgi:hypothetical protein
MEEILNQVRFEWRGERTVKLQLVGNTELVFTV